MVDIKQKSEKCEGQMKDPPAHAARGLIRLLVELSKTHHHSRW